MRGFRGHLPKGKTALLDGKLTIQNVAKADSGTYACSAKNSLGKDSAFALITVTDRLTFTQTSPLNISTKKEEQSEVELCSSRYNSNYLEKSGTKPSSKSRCLSQRNFASEKFLAQKMPGRILAWKKMLIVPLRQLQLLNEMLNWVSI